MLQAQLGIYNGEKGSKAEYADESFNCWRPLDN